MKKPRLVKGWKQSWKWFSVQCMTLSGVVQGTWITLPDDIRAGGPPWLIPGIAIGLLVLGVIGRLIDQESWRH